MSSLARPDSAIADVLAWHHDTDHSGFTSPYPGPTWSDADWSPTPADLAEASGYGIGLDGYHASPPSDMPPELAARWAIGYAHGYAEYTEAEMDAYYEMEAMYSHAFANEGE